jgi:hypothetical protein
MFKSLFFLFYLSKKNLQGKHCTILRYQIDIKKNLVCESFFHSISFLLLFFLSRVFFLPHLLSLLFAISLFVSLISSCYCSRTLSPSRSLFLKPIISLCFSCSPSLLCYSRLSSSLLPFIHDLLFSLDFHIIWFIIQVMWLNIYVKIVIIYVVKF